MIPSIAKRLPLMFFALLYILAALSASAQPIPSGDIRIHYFRPDGNYGGWTVYAFDNTTEDTGNYNGGPVQATGTDSFGVYFDVGVTTAAQEVGIILHNPAAPGGDQKDTPIICSLILRRRASSTGCTPESPSCIQR